MKVRIALGGELIADQSLYAKINMLMGQITGHLCKNIINGEIQMLVSPCYTGNEWLRWNETQEFSLCTLNMQNSFEYVEKSSQVIRKETGLRSLIGELMCDKADMLLIAWSEDVAELSGATWELIRLAYDRKIPCIWISTKSKKVYCLWDSYYVNYSPRYLEAVIEPLHEEDIQPMISHVDNERFLSFWEKKRFKYLKKYKADCAVHPSKEDVLLKPEYTMANEVSGGEKIRQILLDKYQKFDSAAIDSNSKFQAMIYLRSILPLIATIFLAVGFYVETLFGTTTSFLVPEWQHAATIITLIIAGLGFLVHGAINLYTYRLSRNQQILQWQHDFTNNRYIAEMLRILIHFLPYGVSLNIGKLCGENNRLYTYIKHLIDDAEPEEQNINQKNLHDMLQHTKELLDDQITYHQSSEQRYEKIVSSLDKWGKRIMYIGLAVVIGRGVLQFALVLLKTIQEVNNTELINPTIISIARSFLNMLALLLPAWAGYFTTKVQQNNFRYNLNNHQQMISRLNMIREKVVRVMKLDDIPMEVVNTMILELEETMMLQDSLEWYHQYMNSSVKPL